MARKMSCHQFRRQNAALKPPTYARRRNSATNSAHSAQPVTASTRIQPGSVTSS